MSTTNQRCRTTYRPRALRAGAGLLLICCCVPAIARDFRTSEPAQVTGDSPATRQGWRTLPVLTIGETKTRGSGFRPGENVQDVNEARLAFRPVGILDGLAAFSLDERTVRVLANNELGASAGYPYSLASGAELTGARVAYFDIHRTSMGIRAAGLAYDTIYDRAGAEVVDAAQVGGGLRRLCSSQGVEAGVGGLVDDIYFAGEETDGGVEFALDVDGGALYAAPMMGYAAWENVCVVESFGSNKVAILIGDDRGGAPLLLYVGEKGASPTDAYSPPAFLIRNGLGLGALFAWVSDDEAQTSPEEFRGTGNSTTGKFRRIVHFDPSQAGVEIAEGLGYDELGFVSQELQDARAFGDEDAAVEGVGAFRFSRPEDLATNPDDLTQVVMASTGRGSLFPADEWGTTYLIDFVDEALEEILGRELDAIDEIPADIAILYDGDDAGDGQFAGPDFGMRSPDNLDWADDGYIYLQEDRSTSFFGVGGTERDGDIVEGSGIEASVWQLDPRKGELVRILEVDRGAVPAHQADPSPFDIGNWETSGVLDVTRLFPVPEGTTLLLLDVQAHSLQGGGLALAANQGQDLVQGGQLLFAWKAGVESIRAQR